MNFTRPQSVPEDATPIPPVQMSPLQVLISQIQASGQPIPGWLVPIGTQTNVQLETIKSVLMQDAHLNLNAYQKDSQAMKDWITNRDLYKTIGLPTPPQPFPSPKIVDHVFMAKPDGTPANSPDAYSGAYVAWMWQTWDTAIDGGAPVMLPTPPPMITSGAAK